MRTVVGPRGSTAGWGWGTRNSGSRLNPSASFCACQGSVPTFCKPGCGELGISIPISSPTHEMFRKVRFHVQTFRDFLVSFSLLLWLDSQQSGEPDPIPQKSSPEKKFCLWRAASSPGPETTCPTWLLTCSGSSGPAPPAPGLPPPQPAWWPAPSQPPHA